MLIFLIIRWEPERRCWYTLENKKVGNWRRTESMAFVPILFSTDKRCFWQTRWKEIRFLLLTYSWNNAYLTLIHGHYKTSNHFFMIAVSFVIFFAIYMYQLRARRALLQFKAVSLRTRRALSLYKFYGDSALLVLNITYMNCNNALLALNRLNY